MFIEELTPVLSVNKAGVQRNEIMADKLVSIPDEAVLNKIYIIRDQKVMLDRDLAELYGVETKRLNEQVRRNIDRFPKDFMFQLTQEDS